MTLQYKEPPKEQIQDDCNHPHIEDPWIDDHSPIHVTVTGFCVDCGVSLTKTIYPEEFDLINQ